LEKLEERKRKYKRKRKTNSDDIQTTKLVNNFSFGSVENCDYLGQSYVEANLLAEWDKFNTNKQTINDNISRQTSSKNSLFLPDDYVYTEDNDYVGRYNQFHSASLIEDIFHLEKEKLLADDHNCVASMRIDSYVINDFCMERSIPSNMLQDNYTNELNHYVNDFMELHREQDNCPQLESMCKESYVYLERLPATVMREKLRRTSLADSLFDDDHMSSVSESCSSPCNPNESEDPQVCDELCRANDSYDQLTGSLENRSKSCSQDSAFYEDEDQINNETNENSTHTVYMVVATSESTDDKTDVATNASVTNEVTPPEGSTTPINVNKKPTNAGREITDTRLCCGSSIVTRPKIKRRTFEEDPEDQEEKIKRKKLKKDAYLRRKRLEKLAIGVTVKYRDFEKFCRLQYRPADGEGVVARDLSDSESDQEEMSDQDDANDEAVSDLLNSTENDEREDTENCNLEDSAVADLSEAAASPVRDWDLPCCSTAEDTSIIDRTCTPHREEIEERNVFSASEDDLIQEEISRNNVRQWRSFILPKLKTMENKSDFDIHEYGSKIIGPSQIGEEKHFKDIIKGENAAEVARYFIATLQLANTYNVEITGAVSGQLANDTFQIKTLDKTRHHELLEEYQAPSEETFRERLERAQASNSRVPVHSTPCGSSPVKRCKFTNLSSKRLF
jgi:archaellin